MRKMRNGACVLIGVFTTILALPVFSAAWAQGLPKPVPVAGTLTVDGVLVPGDAGDRYRFEITKDDGTSYEPQAVPDTQGLSESGFYQIDIPVFDASEQPGGARIGDIAVIHVSEDSVPLTVTSPPDGRFSVEEPAGTFLIIDIEAERETQANVRPVASASGPDGPVMPGDRVVLDGGDSYDPDPEDTLTYRWEQITSADLSLTDADSLQAEFTVPSEVAAADNPLVFELTVTDNGGLSHSDRVDVAVSADANQPPVADAGLSGTVRGGERVDLDGSGSADPDGQIAAYSWEQTEGPSVALTDADTETPFFTAPEPAEGSLTLRFRLTVTDDEGSEDDDTVTVTVSPAANVAPVASADADGTVVEEGETVTLDATGSSDPDGTVDAYRWRQVDGGPEVVLSDAASATPTFVAPGVDAGGGVIVFELTVTDNEGLTDAADIDISVRDNGITLFPDNAVSFWTSTQQEMGIEAAEGEIVRLDTRPSVGSAGAPQDRIYGDLEAAFILDGPGMDADFMIYVPDPVPEGHRWFRYRSGDGWKEIEGVVDVGDAAVSRMARSDGDATGGTRFRMILSDGGDVDIDRSVDGRFSAILSLGAAAEEPDPDDDDLDGGDDGLEHDNSGETNNCFISEAFSLGESATGGLGSWAYGFPMLLAALGFALTGGRRAENAKKG